LKKPYGKVDVRIRKLMKRGGQLDKWPMLTLGSGSKRSWKRRFFKAARGPRRKEHKKGDDLIGKGPESLKGDIEENHQVPPRKERGGKKVRSLADEVCSFSLQKTQERKIKAEVTRKKTNIKRPRRVLMTFKRKNQALRKEGKQRLEKAPKFGESGHFTKSMGSKNRS